MPDRSDAVYLDPGRSPEERTDDLLSRMTLDEKIAQLGAVYSATIMDGDRFSATKAKERLEHGSGQITRIGAMTLLGPRETAQIMNDVQLFLRNETRLGIPTMVHEESCAGYLARGATQFPQAIGLASSWDPNLVEQVATVIREQLLAVGARQTLAPVLDIARDARWGRCEETYGEDPYLASRIGVAYVKGIQGDDLSKGVVATGKHFMGYGAPEGGLNWAPCQLPKRELLERILPSFEAAIREGGLASIMNGYEEIDGVPCGASKELLDDLLRGELGFEGTVVADYNTVICLMTYHRVAATRAEAGARSLEAGLDVELPMIVCYGEPLKEAIASGRIDESLVDRAARRVLRQKFQLGLFEKPFVDAEAAPVVFDTPSQRELARRAAQRSVVLLLNRDGVLPLDPNIEKLAVIGPNADSIRRMQGDYHYPTHIEIIYGPMRDNEDSPLPEPEEQSGVMPGARREYVDLMDYFTPSVTVLEGIRAAVSETTEILTARGCDPIDPSPKDIPEAVEVARRADAVVLVVGGKSGLTAECTSGEFADRADISLPGAQAELVRSVAATGRPTVVVVIDGRPLALSNVARHATALLHAWLPGEEGGHGVADVLFGRVGPSGRLPITLSRAVGQLPLYYNHKPSGARSQVWGEYRDLPTTPLFPFGHGLSYTEFHYADLSLSDTEPDACGTLEIGVSVTNTGDRSGEEIVQLYLCDRVASVTRPVKELKGFAHVELEPGQTRNVAFELDLRQLAFYDLDMSYVVEPGEVDIMIGSSSEDIRLSECITTTGSKREVVRAEVRKTGVAVR
jgi:beta-glucosidase